MRNANQLAIWAEMGWPAVDVRYFVLHNRRRRRSRTVDPCSGPRRTLTENEQCRGFGGRPEENYFFDESFLQSIVALSMLRTTRRTSGVDTHFVYLKPVPGWITVMATDSSRR